MPSLAAKIVVPVIIALVIGGGFFLWQSEKVGTSFQPPLEDYLGQVNAPDSPINEASEEQEAAGALEQAASGTPSPSAVPSASPTAHVQETKKIPASAATPKPPEPMAAAPSGNFAFDPAWKDAVVNPYCTNRYGDSATDIFFGSGVMIDPRGIILTNAHVGWMFLFADWPNPSVFSCSIRIGSPAEPRYRAALLYIPGEWIADNIAKIGKYVPYEDQGYGKKDYALLYITNTIDPHATLPASFPYLPFDTGPLPLPGSSAYMVGYPASFLGSIAVSRNLALTASPTTVDSLRSIKNSGTLDALAFKGIIAGQHGSSGGAVITAGGKLTALPTFFDDNGSESGQGENTSDNILNAITLEYISRDLKADTGFSLEEFIARENPRAILGQFVSKEAADYRIKYVKTWQKKLDILLSGVDYTAIGQECVRSCAP